MEQHQFPRFQLPNCEVDPLVQHKANPVSEGLWKYGINVWMTDCNMSELGLEKPKLALNKKRKLLDKTQSALAKADELNAKFSPTFSSSGIPEEI